LKNAFPRCSERLSQVIEENDFREDVSNACFEENRYWTMAISRTPSGSGMLVETYPIAPGVAATKARTS